MSKDTLAEYSNNHSGPRSKCGGDMTGKVKELPYSPPMGPKGQMMERPGLGGTNHGNCGTQGKR
jgi:hypothetical protein